MGPLRACLPAASWTRSDAFHLTFAFLGEQEEEILTPLGAKLGPALSSIPRFEVRVSDCGFFPNAGHARVAWVGLQPDEPLRKTAAAVRSALRASKIEFDAKPYRPHLTVARLRQRWSPDHVELFREALARFSPAPAAIDSVVVYQSRLSPKGAIHTPLHRIPLG